MQTYYADLHVHIGRSPSDRPVKITASKSLTIDTILSSASDVKGMDIIGVIDAHVPEILAHLQDQITKGSMIEDIDGGIHYKNTTLILGSEIEVREEKMIGPAHVLVYLPTLHAMKTFSNWLMKHMKNVSLSTQRFYGTVQSLQDKVKALGGLFIPAHVFTPFKGIYGTGVSRSMAEVMDMKKIDAIELGLSADTEMASGISELIPYTFLSNSDAHSTPKIGREYQAVRMAAPTFTELCKAIKKEDGRYVIANYGLSPKLGKYHRTCCSDCFTPLGMANKCPNCGSSKKIRGVYERIMELKNHDPGDVLHNKPPYIHHIPLEFIPKLGPKTLEKLVNYFGTEMVVIHKVPYEELARVVQESIAISIDKARKGMLTLQTGGAGKYGKVDY